MSAVAKIDGSRIRQARLAAGMTQSHLARAINTTERNIARWESSSNQPRVSSVVAIARATGQDFDYFLTPNGDSDDDEESEPVTLDDFLRIRVRQLFREHLNAEPDRLSLQGDGQAPTLGG